MKRLIPLLFTLLPWLAYAQCAPAFLPNQLLTSAQLNAALTAPCISQGSIDGTPIGQTVPAAGSFAALSATGQVVINSTGSLSVPTSAGAMAIYSASVNPNISLFAFGGNPGLLLHAVSGTVSSPTSLLSGTQLGFIGWRGYDGTTFTPPSSSFIQASATENWGPTAHGSNLQLLTTPNGSTVRAVAVTIGNDKSLTVAGPTVLQSTLQVGTAYTAGVMTATGYIDIKDVNGTTYHVLVHN